ncbi:alpha/beta hydrolase [Exiguobacterium sp. AM39-5BH]|uniref:alpha/beta hydrolase n=1 Tax=Exiguobacterium sp. AM39-5BH TaxID=2292355 RepID=UPI000FE1B4C7|nr:alpha/beta hydrolase [Exiguobacterium sp. AM39-5BH]RHB50118.1 alpha/beta hydrolase [Exiguobacterium sp. AM39-5BH]
MNKGLKRAGLGLVGTAVAGAAYVFLSPKPTSRLVKTSFSGGNEVAINGFEEVVQKTSVRKDIDYHSAYENGTFDLIRYEGEKQIVPTIFWVHGGSFVGGDKADVFKYATSIASNGYNVVSVNYALAPDVTYPVPLQQLEEAYTYIAENNDRFRLDLNRVFFAGDSNGAQLVAQFVGIQLNDNYAPSAEVNQVVPKESILGTILMSGPYDLKRSIVESSRAVNRFLFKRIGWAYFGTYNWEDLPVVAEASPLVNIPATFVPTFITDGNTGSFETQAKEFAIILSGRTDVTSVFYDRSEHTLGHDYHFEMDKPAASATYRRLITFLRETTR